CVGNVWTLIKRWRPFFAAIETINEAITGRRELSLGLRYPPVLGLWPAFVLLLAFAWLELVYPNPAVPRLIASIALAYSALTFAGMVSFGRERWLALGEVFTAVFGPFARVSPVHL